MTEGTIIRLVISRGFGFIQVANQPDVFFHMGELADDLPFDESLQERRVQFEQVDSDKGPRAVAVRAAI